jgi:hypothetical protein
MIAAATAFAPAPNDKDAMTYKIVMPTVEEIDLPDSGWDKPEGDGWEEVGNYADANGDFWIRWVRLTWPSDSVRHESPPDSH